jgi:hypothetical protein
MDGHEDDDEHTHSRVHWEAQYCREGVCCRDIHDRVNKEWNMYELYDDLDDCDIAKPRTKKRWGMLEARRGVISIRPKKMLMRRKKKKRVTVTVIKEVGASMAKRRPKILQFKA